MYTDNKLTAKAEAQLVDVMVAELVTLAKSYKKLASQCSFLAAQTFIKVRKARIELALGEAGLEYHFEVVKEAKAALTLLRHILEQKIQDNRAKAMALAEKITSRSEEYKPAATIAAAREQLCKLQDALANKLERAKKSRKINLSVESTSQRLTRTILEMVQNGTKFVLSTTTGLIVK